MKIFAKLFTVSKPNNFTRAFFHTIRLAKQFSQAQIIICRPLLQENIMASKNIKKDFFLSLFCYKHTTFDFSVIQCAERYQAFIRSASGR